MAKSTIAKYTPVTIVVTQEDRYFWEDVKKVFQHGQATLWTLNGITGSIAKTRRLRELGLVDWDEEGNVALTGKELEKPEKVLSVGDLSGHPGFNIDKMR